MALLFSKMHGAGNDFAVLDCRGSDALPDADTLRLMGHRHFGIGFDQLLTIEKPRSAGAVAAYRIINQDGSFAGQCGNGARCVAHWLVLRGVASEASFALDSPAGHGDDGGVDPDQPARPDERRGGNERPRMRRTRW